MKLNSLLLIGLLAAGLAQPAMAAKKPAKCDTCGVVKSVVEQEVEKDGVSGAAADAAGQKAATSSNPFAKMVASKVQSAMKVKVWDVTVTLDEKKEDKTVRLAEQPTLKEGDKVKIDGEKVVLIPAKTGKKKS